MKKTILFAMLLSATATAASAQQTSKLATKTVDTLKVYELQDVQVLSTRASKNTPMAFSNISKEQIRGLNYGQDIPQLLSLTPSVTFTSDAGNGVGYTSLRVRGSDPSRINVTANGIPMNDAESSNLFWVNFGDFISSAQSLQLQRGVGTSTNGAGAFGATLNILTENIGTKPFIGLDGTYGSYNTHKEMLRFGTGLIGGHWGLQGRLSNIYSDGYLERASTKLNSYFLQAGYFSDNTMVKFITYNGKEQTYHAWNYTSKYEQSLYGRRYNSCGEYYTEDGGTRYYDNQTDNYHSQNYQLIWNQNLLSLFSLNHNPYTLNLNLALHYTRGDGYYEEYKVDKYLSDYGLSSNSMKTDLVRRKMMGNDFYGFVGSVNFDNKRGLQAVLGGGWNRYSGDHFGRVIWVKESSDVSLTPDYEYYRDNARKSEFNVYGKVTYEFIRGLNGFLDLQYRNVNYRMQDPADWYKEEKPEGDVVKTRFNFFNPKFGFTYNFLRYHKLYISYAISHKEPVRNNYENYYNAAVAGDEHVRMPRAERLNDLEFGYKFQTSTISAGVNLYYMNYKNQFVLTGEIDDIGEAITSNLDKSYRLGVELEAVWQPLSWFRWDLNGTWSRNRVKDITVLLTDGSVYTIQGETPLSFSPDLIFNNIFTFTYAGFRGSIQSQYISEQYLNNTGFKYYETYVKDDATGLYNQVNVGMTLKAHFTTNVDLSYSFSQQKWFRRFSKGICKDITMGVTFYNIFNSLYDNNGWSACSYRLKDGQLNAYTSGGDLYEAGFAPSAPFNFLAHLSINF